MASSRGQSPPGETRWAPIVDRPFVKSAGTDEQHERIARLSPLRRYVEWQALVGELLDEEAVTGQALEARANLAAYAAAGRIQADPQVAAAAYAQEIRDKFCLLLTVAPDINRGLESELIRFVGLPDFLRDTQERPVLLLGDHIHEYKVAVMGVAAHRQPVHIMSLIRPDNRIAFSQNYSYMDDLGRRYVDPQVGNRIPVIMVPQPTAAMRCLRAFRLRQSIFFHVDGDLGIANLGYRAKMLGRDFVVPQALYELALSQGAAFYRLTIEMGDDRRSAAQHRYVVHLERLEPPSPDDITAFHQLRLDEVTARIMRRPSDWSLWRYWNHDIEGVVQDEEVR